VSLGLSGAQPTPRTSLSTGNARRNSFQQNWTPGASGGKRSPSEPLHKTPGAKKSKAGELFKSPFESEGKQKKKKKTKTRLRKSGAGGDLRKDSASLPRREAPPSPALSPASSPACSKARRSPLAPRGTRCPLSPLRFGARSHTQFREIRDSATSKS